MTRSDGVLGVALPYHRGVRRDDWIWEPLLPTVSVFLICLNTLFETSRYLVLHIFNFISDNPVLEILIIYYYPISFLSLT